MGRASLLQPVEGGIENSDRICGAMVEVPHLPLLPSLLTAASCRVSGAERRYFWEKSVATFRGRSDQDDYS